GDATAEPPDGVRLLYDARVAAAGGRTSHFRLAVAFRPPDRLRLEALGPAGGTRLVIATDGAEAVALLVSDRRFDRAPATPEGLARWTGLPLGATDLGALLQGKPPCGTSVRDTGAGASIDLRCEIGSGERWAGRVSAGSPDAEPRLVLTRSGDPVPARLADALFAPEIPPGFEPARIATAPPGAAPLLGAGSGPP
ncbi:MAG TPA: hypothetical protein VJV75_14060, partial [Candidatus Polarisedimenticolia bacterium]|nr:hypothetical protein [Candidatus Polarisedimenticolia bacterium]